MLSTFGHMFAPRHAQAAAELARVCRPGGVVGTCTWATHGAPGEMFKIVGGFMPPPPDFAQSPVLWGDEAHIREMFEPHGLEVEITTETVDMTYESADGYVEMFERDFGPMVMARQVLGDRWPELHEAYVPDGRARERGHRRQPAAGGRLPAHGGAQARVRTLLNVIWLRRSPASGWRCSTRWPG